jgi:hypothetical protein
MLHRMRTLSMSMVAFLAVAGIAAAAGEAPPCHPDPAGTRTLIVTGAVTDYRFAAPGTLAVTVRTGRCADVARWNYAATARATAAASCAGSSAARPAAAAAQKLVATSGDRMVRINLGPAGVDRPDRLDVFSRTTGHKIASWPLIPYSNANDRPARVALYGGIAVLAGTGRGALYVVRVADGRIAELGIERAGDRPIIGSAGVAYREDLYLKNARAYLAHREALKLVPLAAVERELRLAGRPVVTSGRIGAISMDGQRVAFAVHDPAGQCDRVMIWLPAWHFVNHVSKLSGATCLPTHAAGGVTSVAMAGSRLMWTTRYGQTTRVIAASAMGCVEWVVARPSTSVAALAGDGSVMAYGLGGAVGVVPAKWEGRVVSHAPAAVVGMSVDSHRIATLYRDGTVTVMKRSGAPVSSFAAGPARAVALRGDQVAILRSGRLAIYDAKTGALTHSWTVPADARSVDLAYGLAVVAAGRDVLALNVATGHTARLMHAPGRVAAQFDAPGAVVQYNAGGHGHVQFIPLSTIEARTR